MTSPKLETVKHHGSRFYIHPLTGVEYRGVTSVLNAIPKDFLRYWGQGLVAQAAVEYKDAVDTMIANGDSAGAVDWLKNAPNRNTAGAAERGTLVHDLYERLSLGEDIGRVHPDLRPFVESWHEWNDEFQPTFLHVEGAVVNEAMGYGGSFDFIAEIAGQVIMGDYKTSKAVYPEVALQMWAYANADHILSEDGSTEPLPKIDAAAVFHCRPEGWKFHPIDIADPELPAVFAALQKVGEWDNIKKKLVGRPIGKGKR